MRQGLRRVPVSRSAAAVARPYTFVAPVRGWVTNENLAAAGRGGAYRLDNWFPTQTGIRLRAGSELHATIGTGPVEALMSYVSGSTRKFFAADDAAIFDVTAVASTTVAPAADVSGQTSGDYSSFQFETAGGDFLYALNGTDKPQLYDGTTWVAIDGVSTPAITGVTTSTLAQGWVYRSRIFMVQKDTSTAWYLPVDSLGGAASDFSLSGVFQKGGSLLFGATWSLDSGSGIDDKCVFVSTEGEVAVYEGAYPGDTAWSLVGKYDITPPLGKNAWMHAGGDLLILTEDGIVPISQAIQKDTVALSLAAVTRPIERDWKTEVIARKSVPWQILKWPSYNMAIVSLPVISADTPARCFVVNLQTGAWSRYTGWDVRSLVLHNGWGYFGSSDGKIYKAESTGSDNGSNYTSTYVGLFDHVKNIGTTKVVRLARATFLSGRAFTPKISASVNYAVTLPSDPDAYIDTGSSNKWDVDKWDVAVWSGVAERSATMKWVGMNAVGFTIAPQIQVTLNQAGEPDAELASFDIMYELAGVVV